MRRARGATLPALMLALVVGAGWTLLSGRLFTMPAERQYLDERRRAGQHGAPPAALEPGIDRPAARAPDAGRAAAASVAAPTAQPAPVITFRGFIQGRNGRTAAWLSGGGEALARCPAATGAPADQAAVRLPGGVVVRLRSGQSYDPRRGAVLDATGAVP